MAASAQRTLTISEHRSMVGFSPKDGDYIINSELDKFTGTWEWVSGTDTFRMYLEKSVKAPTNMQGTQHADLLSGHHIYKKNHTLVETSLNSSHLTISFGVTWKSPYKVEFFFEDLTKDKTGRATLELLEPGTRVRIGSQARFQVSDRGKVIVNGMDGNRPFMEGFTVPTDVIMTKIE